MPSYPDKCIDLLFTDYPWGKDMKPNKRQYLGRTLDNQENKVFFDDSPDTIDEEFTLKWFWEADRIVKRMVLVIPEDHKKFWYRNADPIGDVPVLWKNGFSTSKVAKRSRKSTYLFFGKFDQDKKLPYDFIAKRYNSKGNQTIELCDDPEIETVEPYTLEWGFCNKEKKMFKHPSPKGTKIPLFVLKHLNPESVIDPFAGSGSYLMACKILNIKFIGFEINKKDYRQDIHTRFNQKFIDEEIK